MAVMVEDFFWFFCPVMRSPPLISSPCIYFVLAFVSASSPNFVLSVGRSVFWFLLALGVALPWQRLTFGEASRRR